MLDEDPFTVVPPDLPNLLECMKNRSVGYLGDRVALKKKHGDEASSLDELSFCQVRKQPITMILIGARLFCIRLKRW